jgi:hypothetical protein
MFWNKKKTVRVILVDAATGASFAKTEITPEQLPASFEAHTTVDVQGEPWEVLSAVPITRAEYVKAGELRLNLRKLKIAKVPPSEILYSLPTLCDRIPVIAAGTSKLSKNVLELHEDDWRQIELVSLAHMDEVRAVFDKVETIRTKERAPSGAFKTLYVRTELASPMATDALTPGALLSVFSPVVTSYDGLAYERVAGLIEAGFALRTAASLDLYGVAPGGRVTTVGLALRALSSELEADAARLASLMREHHLALVDWCRVEVVEGQDARVLGYLRSR